MNHVSPGIRSFINSVGHYELSYVYDRLVERLNITPERLSLEGQRKRANSLMSRTTIPGSRNRESAMTDIALSDIETSLALRKPQTKRVTKKRALSCGICGTPHHDIYGCFYIHKHLRPEWFKPNIEISEHIVAELRKPNSDIVNLVKRAKNQKKEKKEYEDPADVSEELLLRQY
ncbi:hypothetical protein SEPCBS57363_003113 [Sporothrix epigloea]|uniref:Uncharacterized protein n=1 Tax=Sporothrix epigloea TaxID=1892477 RepID=A0ABP0DN60_9PEZI